MPCISVLGTLSLSSCFSTLLFGQSRRVWPLLQTDLTCTVATFFKDVTFIRTSALLGVSKLLWIKSSLLPAFVNKDLLEQSYVHSFTYCLWLFLCYRGRVEQLQQRQQSPQSLKYLLPDSSHKKVC